MFGHLVVFGHGRRSESFKLDTFCPLRVIVLCFLLLSGPAYKTTKSTGRRKELVASDPLAMPTVAWREFIGVCLADDLGFRHIVENSCSIK